MVTMQKVSQAQQSVPRQQQPFQLPPEAFKPGLRFEHIICASTGLILSTKQEQLQANLANHAFALVSICFAESAVK